MQIKVYSRHNCNYCTLTKDLLNKKGLQYEEVIVGLDMTREQFFEQFPGVRTVPQVTVDGTLVGGYEKLTEWVKHYDQAKFLAG